MLTLTIEQSKHLDEMAQDWETNFRGKYKKGVREHGGNLWDMPTIDLLDEAIMENMDQFAYLWTARQKILRGEK